MPKSQIHNYSIPLVTIFFLPNCLQKRNDCWCFGAPVPQPRPATPSRSPSASPLPRPLPWPAPTKSSSSSSIRAACLRGCAAVASGSGDPRAGAAQLGAGRAGRLQRAARRGVGWPAGAGAPRAELRPPTLALCRRTPTGPGGARLGLVWVHFHLGRMLGLLGLFSFSLRFSSPWLPLSSEFRRSMGHGWAPGRKGERHGYH